MSTSVNGGNWAWIALLQCEFVLERLLIVGVGCDE